MRIAITGGIAEGKSTVLSHLKDLGKRTDSADSIARKVFLQNDVQEAISKIVKISLPIQTHLLRDEISRDASLRRKVNRILHPRILTEIEMSEAQYFEVPLLLETCVQGLYDQIWVVTCGPAEQLLRLSARVGDMGEAKRLISTQLPSIVKCAFADQIIRTNGPDDVVKVEIGQILAFEDVR
ncbi:MAG: dephospho-CoA kinase [Chlorobia bacterium]|nr:dephospho-CoA kinase [Fimbriimonadaceae bacterium]